MCVTTINDRKVPVNLKEKQEGCMEKMEWNRGKGKWCNYILQSYKKKEGILFKSETIPHKQSRFGKRNSAWGKMAMKNDICLCVLFKTKHC